MMKLPKIKSYGDYSSENYGLHCMMFEDPQGNEFYFSYNTLVAFVYKKMHMKVNVMFVKTNGAQPLANILIGLMVVTRKIEKIMKLSAKIMQYALGGKQNDKNNIYKDLIEKGFKQGLIKLNIVNRTFKK